MQAVWLAARSLWPLDSTRLGSARLLGTNSLFLPEEVFVNLFGP